MANTYTALYYHLVFSTKNRAPFLKPGIDERVWAFIGAIAQTRHMTPIQIGGIEDHIHALVAAHPTLAPSQIAQYLKGDSSKWIHETFPDLCLFKWQDGYGAFTVSKSNLTNVIRYIQNQREHHQEVTFQAEYLKFLRKHGIEFDERYLWG
ncbi:MAG: IS200/IS605 family transposase [Blastocatellia bacterium]|nr:IS200/IS605 family transposase [Blastocatellia bacterium]